MNPRALMPTSSNIRVYLTIRGGSRKKMAKKMIPNVPTNKNVYTNASMQKKSFYQAFQPFSLFNTQSRITDLIDQRLDDVYVEITAIKYAGQKCGLYLIEVLMVDGSNGYPIYIRRLYKSFDFKRLTTEFRIIDIHSIRLYFNQMFYQKKCSFFEVFQPFERRSSHELYRLTTC